jgi:hypothetical protein
MTYHYECEPIHFEVAHWNPDEGVVLPGWYFWIETWTYRIGPFPDYDAACVALTHYGESL